MRQSIVFATEKVLREAQEWMSHAVLVVSPSGGYSASTQDVLYALAQQLRVPTYNMDVTRHQPDTFLVRFTLPAQRDRALLARSFNIGGTNFDITRGCPDLNSSNSPFWYHTKVTIEGLPIHLWKESVHQ
jgi:hypothetical protein